jgi:hypothetical protein
MICVSLTVELCFRKVSDQYQCVRSLICLFVGLLVCWFACLLVCLLACLLACLFTYIAQHIITLRPQNNSVIFIFSEYGSVEKVFVGKREGGDVKGRQRG